MNNHYATMEMLKLANNYGPTNKHNVIQRINQETYKRIEKGKDSWFRLDLGLKLKNNLINKDERFEETISIAIFQLYLNNLVSDEHLKMFNSFSANRKKQQGKENEKLKI